MKRQSLWLALLCAVLLLMGCHAPETPENTAAPQTSPTQESAVPTTTLSLLTSPMSSTASAESQTDPSSETVTTTLRTIVSVSEAGDVTTITTTINTTTTTAVTRSTGEPEIDYSEFM